MHVLNRMFKDESALLPGNLSYFSLQRYNQTREEQRLEAAQMKFLRHLPGITKLDKEKNHCIRGGGWEHRTQ
jgi:hypothetical protein